MSTAAGASFSLSPLFGNVLAMKRARAPSHLEVSISEVYEFQGEFMTSKTSKCFVVCGDWS
jgi:hypothetical protein